MEDHTSIGQHSPQEMARVLYWILPAITPPSRAAMLSGMRASAPAPVFDGVVAMAKQRLQPSDWRKLAKQLHLAPAQAALSAG